MTRKWRPGRRRLRVGVSALAMIAITTPLVGGARADEDATEGFRLVARMAFNTSGPGVLANGSMLVDPGHRRAYGFELNQPSQILLHRYDLDALDYGSIATSAGTGTAGFSGDGGAAASADLNAPSGIAVDSAGNTYIADTGNNRVRRVSTEGTISTIAGTGTAGYNGEGTAVSAQLNGPVGVTTDSAGTRYIADTGNNRVRRVTAGGTISTIAGTGTAGFSGDGGAATAAELNAPRSIAFDSLGKLFVADTGNRRVRMMRPASTITTSSGTGTAGSSGDGGLAASAALNAPTSVAVDSAGDTYVTESSGHRVRKIKGWEMLPPIRLQGGVNVFSAPSVNLAVEEPLAAIDPDGSRIFLMAAGLMYEVKTNSPDPWNPVVNAWVAQATGQGGSTDSISGNRIVPHGMSYDPGGQGPDGTVHPPSVFLVGRASQANNSGLVFQNWDASPGAAGRDFNDPEGRLRWAYPTRSCSAVGGTGHMQTPVVRAANWLYTYCDAFSDRTVRGALRVKLIPGPDTPPLPDPTAEEFFPGATGGDDNVAFDPESQRMYITAETQSTRNVLVFDGTANEDRGSYTGEIQLSKTTAPSTAGPDRVTGRWYFQSDGGLSYQNGRLRRVAQAVRSIAAPDDIVGDGREEVSLEGFKTWKPMAVDPAVVDDDGQITRPARVFVYRASTEARCPVAGMPCYEVFEDSTPLPGTPPPPDEATLNKPEGPGLTGIYDGVASAYGLRMRFMRGLSTTWPGGVPGLGPVLENPPAQNPPANNPVGYATDPFFFYGGDCGRNDREVTFGRIRQSKLSGDLSIRDASAVALPVDPDVIRPSAEDDTQTRTDVAQPDACTVAMMRTMSGPFDNNDRDDKVDEDEKDGIDNDGDGQIDEDGPDDNPSEDFWGGLDSATAPFKERSPVKEWPYETIVCQGDGSKEGGGSVQGLAPATGEASCQASGDEPATSASTVTALNPGQMFITVQGTDTSTKIIRHPGQGIETISRAVVKGIDIGGVIGIDEMVVTGKALAKGYATQEGTSARVETTREFFGLSLAGERQCAVCDPEQVVDTINRFIGPIGYARAADPEPDWAGGTVKGTKAVVQKNLPLQDADTVTNNDFSTEWPGLEIIIYRDGATRGRGRWELQFGGVFSQAQFGVVEALAEEPPPTEEPPAPVPPTEAGPETPGDPGIPPRFVPGTSTGGTPGRQVAIGDDSEALGDSTNSGAESPGGAVQQILRGLERTLKGALLLMALWALIYSPVYVARRRQFLREVMSQS
jgi:hypothetical protein